MTLKLTDLLVENDSKLFASPKEMDDALMNDEIFTSYTVNADGTLDLHNYHIIDLQTIKRNQKIFDYIIKNKKWPIPIKHAGSVAFVGLPINSCKNFPIEADEIEIRNCPNLKIITYNPQKIFQLTIGRMNVDLIMVPHTKILNIVDTKFQEIYGMREMEYLYITKCQTRKSQLQWLQHSNLKHVELDNVKMDNLSWCPDILETLELFNCSIKHFWPLPSKLRYINFRVSDTDFDAKDIIDNLPNNFITINWLGKTIVLNGKVKK